MANEILVSPGTAIVFTETGGAATFTAKNLATGAGRVSAQLDRGAGAIAMRYRWEAEVETAANVTPGAAGIQVEIYVVTAHSTAAAVDSTVGTSDAALTAKNQLAMATPIGVLVPTGTAAGVGPFRRSGVVEIFARYVSVAFWNAMGQALTNVDGENVVRLIPMPDEVQ